MRRTLQQICLSSIIQNFDYHHEVYGRTENNAEKLKFEFLRRVYTFQVVTELHNMGSMKKEYVDFLINNYLKILSTEWFGKSSWSVIRSKIDEIGHSLQQVFFHGTKMLWKRILCRLPNVKEVSYAHADDEFLYAITLHCPNIEFINLNFSKVTNHGIEHLCRQGIGKPPCSKLKEIMIDLTDVNNDGIKNLFKNLPFLEKIDYQKLPEVLHSLHGNYSKLEEVQPCNLRHLNLMYLRSHFWLFSKVLKTCLVVCPHLKSLSCPVVRQENLKLCSGLQELEKLHLHSFSETFVALDDFFKLKGGKLEFVQLCNFPVSISNLAQSCPNLNSLHLKRVTFQANDYATVFVFNSLEKITFKKFVLIDSFTIQSIATILSSSPNLEVLRFRDCEILSSELNDQLLKACNQLKLTHVDFGMSSVEPELLEEILLTCTSLQSLNVSDCKFLSGGVDVVDKLKDIARTLPNEPVILHTEHSVSYSEYDDSASECSMLSSEGRDFGFEIDGESEDEDYNMDFNSDIDDDYLDLIYENEANAEIENEVNAEIENDVNAEIENDVNAEIENDDEGNMQ